MGTFAISTFAARLLCGEGEVKFLRVHTRKNSFSPTKSNRVLWSSDTQHFGLRQEDGVFDFSRPRARIAFLVRYLIFVPCFCLGRAWLGTAIPLSTEIVTCVCRSCRVEMFFWAYNALYFQEEKGRENRLEKANVTRAMFSLLTD